MGISTRVGGIVITPTNQNIANMNNVRAQYDNNTSSVTVFILTALVRNTSVTCTPQKRSTTCTIITLCLFVVKGNSVDFSIVMTLEKSTKILQVLQDLLDLPH